MTKTLKHQVRNTYNNLTDFKEAMPSFETASLGALRWVPGGGSEPVATDFIGVRNDRTGGVVGAMKGGYALVQMPDLADMALQAFEGMGAKFSHADVWATESQQYLGLFADAPHQFDGDDYKVGFGVRNSFDGTLPVMVGGIALRPACWNGVRTAFKDAVRYKHTKGKVWHLTDALAALAEQSMNEVVDFGAKLTAARTVQVDPLGAGNILRDTFGPRAGNAILEMVPKYVRNANAHDDHATDSLTRWSLYQAATDHFSHGDGLSVLTTERGLLASNGLLSA